MSEALKTQKAAGEANLKAVDEFIRTFAPANEDFMAFLAELLSRKLLKLVLLDLWEAYYAYEYPKNDPFKAQLKLIFHGYEPPAEGGIDMQQLLNLLITGKIDGKKPISSPANIFPAGFWQLSAVKDVIARRLQELIVVFVQSSCRISFDLPADWEDEKYPEGLFISLEDQTVNMIEAVSDNLIDVCKELVQPEPEETEPEEAEEKTDTGPETAPDGDEEPEEGDKTPPEEDKKDD